MPMTTLSFRRRTVATDDYCLIKSKITFIWQIVSELFLVTVQ